MGLDADITALRTLIASAPEDDSVRELYGELCDRYRDEPGSIEQLKPIGEEIRKLEAEGKLPSSLVARSNRRRRP